MGLFNNEAEINRKQSLKELEDKRLQFIAKFKNMGHKPLRTLYAQCDGGFTAVCQCENGLLLLKGPAPGAEEDFSAEHFDSLTARLERIEVKPEGLGGILGFGKKGGSGFRLVLIKPNDEEFALEFMAGLGTYLDIPADRDSLFREKRRRGNANFVWDFRPIERDALKKIESTWLKIING